MAVVDQDHMQAIPTITKSSASLAAIIERVCGRISPLWDLANYVAVNPFLGFANQPLVTTARIIRDGLGAQLLPELAFYQEQWRAGAFGMDQLRQAARRSNQSAEFLESILDGRATMPTRPAIDILSYAERRDLQQGSDWHTCAVRHVTHWCALYSGQGLARWKMPADGLYSGWRAAAQIDRTLEIEGLAGWRGWAADLPASAEEAIATMLAQLGIPVAACEPYLYRLLAGVYGWASFLRRLSWQQGHQQPGPLLDLLAMQICVDVGIELLSPAATAALRPAPAVEDEQIRAIFQEALEDGYLDRLHTQLLPPSLPAAERAALQALFCIDVRSEVFRRHLEAQASQIQTFGFAGFFGVALNWQNNSGSSARCPVLLTPAATVRSQAQRRPALAQAILKELQMAPCAAFSFVETAGLTYGLRLVRDTLNWRSSAANDDLYAPFTLEPDGTQGLTVAERCKLAANILKNSSLTQPLGRLVLLCGHASKSENNAHVAGLDCGACGGHGGAINARVAAAILNDPAVRDQLGATSRQIPADTWFLAGLHDTSADQVALLDTEQVPSSHQADLLQLRQWLAQAGAQTRTERAAALGVQSPAQQLLDRLRQRATDWSEVRPEWALARNASFIAARRARTRGVDLQGRSFLHEYDWTNDPDGSILSMILSAPMVVASWINLQYFASTVDPHMFGCGTKTLHNRIGALGVVLGNGGDLRTGLPLQSIQDANGRWYHQPLRLQVIVEAPLAQIEAVLAHQPAVKALVENGWVRLLALAPTNTTLLRWEVGQGWSAA